MDTWNRRHLWAEHDAAHARQQRLRQLLLVIALLTAWSSIAVLGLALAPNASKVDAPRSSCR